MEKYLGVSSFKDRHGKTRWRYRRKGKTIALPGNPGEPAFEAAYSAALEDRERPAAQIRRHPSSATPRSLGAAWRKVQQSAEWKEYDQATKDKNIRLAEAFLASRVIPEDPTTWREICIADLRRRHLKDIISAHSGTPHKAKHLLTAIRKMIYAALDEEWIDVDPSYKLKWRPKYKGWKAWPIEAMKLFEARWPVGSNARLAYSLAFWLGNRASDVVSLRWDQRSTRRMVVRGELRDVDGFTIRQKKGGEAKVIFVPISPALRQVLEATPKVGDTVLLTAFGKAYSKKSITNTMAGWTRAAGLGPGHTLHGLRKTLGKMLAEGGASTRQLMEVLGHDDIEHAELYSREAEQALLATEGMDRVIDLHDRLAG